MKNEIDYMTNEIENIFLKNISIETHHDTNYIDHKNFLFEIKKWLQSKFTLTEDLPRYSIREIVKDDQITGISYLIEETGNWVLYNDVKNLLIERELIRNRLREVQNILDPPSKENT